MADPTVPGIFSPLDRFADRFGGDAVAIAPIGFRTLLNVRGRPDDAAFNGAVKRAFGVAPPHTPNRWSGSTDRAALWLGPDEWLLMAPDGEADTLEAAIRAARGDDPWLSVTNVSDNYTGLAVAGPAAREMLAKGCPVDLHPRALPENACIQTLVAQSRALVRLVDEPPRFELWARNSFARYLVEWLFDAAREYKTT